MNLERERVLVLTTSFAPERAIGSVRLSKFVKYLVRMEYSVTVISPQLDADAPRDSSLESPELARATRITVPQSAWFETLFAPLRKRVLAGGGAAKLITSGSGDSVIARLKARIGRHLQFGYTIARNLDWSRQAKWAIASRGERFDVVISSYPSLGAMWAAAWARRRGIGGRWVADFRDPVNYADSSPLIFRVNTWIQSNIVEQADAVITVSEGVAMKLRGRPAGEVAVIPNGYDPDDLISVEAAADTREGATAFCYAGSLHGGRRDLSPLFAALRELVDEGRVRSDSFVVAYAGKDFGILARQAGRYGLTDRLVDHGFVEREQSLLLQQRADVVVVATWNTACDQGIMTGKLFECFLMRKPVLGLVAGDLAGSELRSVLEEVGAGIAYEDADPGTYARLKEFLASACSPGRPVSFGAASYGEGVERYSYSRIAEKLSTVIQAC